MNVMLEYILSNYTWILFGLIIILLAIIGWYADKTNFGQGKSSIQNKESEELSVEELKKQLGDKKLLDEINGSTQDTISTELIQKNIQQPIVESDITIEHPIKLESQNIEMQSEMNFDPMTGEPLNKNIETEQIIVDDLTKDNNIQHDNLENDSSFDLEAFEKKFNEIIPEKEIIDEGLLEDIEDLTLDKTQKIDLNSIPDLDDVELPRIKKMKTNDEGIWKF